MTTEEYAKRYNRSRTIVLKFCRTGRLPAHRVMERGQWRWEIEGIPQWPETQYNGRRKPWRERGKTQNPRPPITDKEKAFAAMFTALKRTGRHKPDTSLNWGELRIAWREWMTGPIEESGDIGEATGYLLQEAV